MVDCLGSHLQNNFSGDTIIQPLYVNTDIDQETPWADSESDTDDETMHSLITLYPEVSDAMTLASQ
jgi:hypothetical protein